MVHSAEIVIRRKLDTRQLEIPFQNFEDQIVHVANRLTGTTEPVILCADWYGHQNKIQTIKDFTYNLNFIKFEIV